MIKLARGAAALGCVVVGLVGCGGGGGGSETPDDTWQMVNGQVWLGPVDHATITVYRLNADGTRAALGTSTTDSEGHFAFKRDGSNGTVIQVEATGGTFVDAGNAQVHALDVPLRVTYVTSTTDPVRYLSISAFSEAASRVIDRAPPTAAAVRAADDLVARSLRISTIVGVDLSGSTCSNMDTCGLHYIASAVTTLPRRWSFASLDAVLDALTRIWTGDYDEALAPEMLRASYALIPEARRAAVGGWILGSPTPLTATTLPRWYPHGTAASGATGHVPDGAYVLLNTESTTGAQVAPHRFDAQGALSYLQYNPYNGDAFRAYSTVTDGLYSDGEVGIGRWIGGAFQRGNDYVAPAEGMPYALGTPAPARTDCAFEVFDLAAVTPTSVREELPSANPVIALQPDSKVSIQHLGDGHARVAYDLGFTMKDGSMRRYGNEDGLLQPWNGPEFQSIQGSDWVGIGSSAGAMGTMVRAGAAGDKLATMLSLETTTLAAVFKRNPATPPRDDICAPDLAVATPIAPPPTGPYYRYFSRDGSRIGQFEWAADGAYEFPSSIERRELYGAGAATIGRVHGAFDYAMFRDEPSVRSKAYATALPITIAQGTAPLTYHLQAATTPVLRVVASGSPWIGEYVSGHIDSVTLLLTPSATQPFSGTGTLTLSGVVGGLPYHLETPVTLDMSSGAFVGDGAAGEVSGPDASHAVLFISTQAKGLEFAVLLEAD